MDINPVVPLTCLSAVLSAAEIAAMSAALPVPPAPYPKSGFQHRARGKKGTDSSGQGKRNKIKKRRKEKGYGY